MAKVRVEGIRDVQRRLKRVQDEGLRERVVVAAARKSARPVLSAVQNNITSAVDKGSQLAEKMGIRKIPRRVGGTEAPGVVVSLRKKSDFTIETQTGSALSLYWVEYGTARRTQDSTGRDTGAFPAKAPIRSAYKRTRDVAFSGFRAQIVAATNRQIKRNKL
jgi:hypothetical protein